MPCGPRARLTAYVTYTSVAFTERDVLAAALTELYTAFQVGSAGSDALNALPVHDAGSRVVGRAAVVVSARYLPSGFGDLGFVYAEGAYVPLLPADTRSVAVLRSVRAAYGRAKAEALAEAARGRYRASMLRTMGADQSVTIRVRF